jgi:hypothetical protein
LVVVTWVVGFTTVLVHVLVPPPKETPGWETTPDEALGVPSTLQNPCAGISIVWPLLVNLAEPRPATPAGVAA